MLKKMWYRNHYIPYDDSKAPWPPSMALTSIYFCTGLWLDYKSLSKAKIVNRHIQWQTCRPTRISLPFRDLNNITTANTLKTLNFFSAKVTIQIGFNGYFVIHSYIKKVVTFNLLISFKSNFHAQLLYMY